MANINHIFIRYLSPFFFFISLTTINIVIISTTSGIINTHPMVNISPTIVIRLTINPIRIKISINVIILSPPFLLIEAIAPIIRRELIASEKKGNRSFLLLSVERTIPFPSSPIIMTFNSYCFCYYIVF